MLGVTRWERIVAVAIPLFDTPVAALDDDFYAISTC